MSKDVDIEEVANRPGAQEREPAILRVDADSLWGKAADAVERLCGGAMPSDPEQVLRISGLITSLVHKLSCFQVEAGMAWVLLNPPLDVHDAEITDAEDYPISAGGPGAPKYRGGASDMFMIASNMGTRASDAHLSRYGELITRFPKVWSKVKEQEIPLSRAFAWANKTQHLTQDVAALLDAEMAPHFKDATRPKMDRAVAHAEFYGMPELIAQRSEEELENRGVWLDRRNTRAGTCRIYGELDAPDALAFQDLLAAAGKKLIEEGLCDRLDYARAKALGMISRGEITIESTGANRGTSSGANTDTNAPSIVLRTQLSVPAVQLKMYVHYAREQLTDDGAHGVATVEGLDNSVLMSQIAHWADADSSAIKLTQVIDLEADYESIGYQPSARIREQVMLRDEHCVFPSCERRARQCDIDHIVAHAAGGCTCTSNLAALCRRHHRAKTRKQWEYSFERDAYLWECTQTFIKAKYLRVRKSRPTWWRTPTADPYLIRTLPEKQRIPVMEILHKELESVPPF